MTVQTSNSGLREVSTGLRQLEKRDWWQWGTAVVVSLLLTTGIILLALNPLLIQEGPLSESDTKQVVVGLAGLVLLFNLNSIYQQILIKRLRRQLAHQMVTMAKLQVQAEEFEHLAVVDPLTGLFNRRLMDERLSGEITRSKRHGHPLAVLSFDLNEFKQINDRYGHPAGDLVLKEFAHRLKRALRVSDVAARIGGDEFLALLPECVPGQVKSILSRLTHLEVPYHGETVPFSCSAGWADYQSGESVEQILDRADQMLYIDKRDRKSPSHSTSAPGLTGA